MYYVAHVYYVLILMCVNRRIQWNGSAKHSFDLSTYFTMLRGRKTWKQRYSNLLYVPAISKLALFPLSYLTMQVIRKRHMFCYCIVISVQYTSSVNVTEFQLTVISCCL